MDIPLTKEISLNGGFEPKRRMPSGSWLVFALSVSALNAAGPETLTLKKVMLRAHAYVVEYMDHRLSGVLAEERYEQRVIGQNGDVERTRTLVSEYLIFQLPPDESWFAIRDVLEVDGAPVPDHQQRFEQLFSRSTTGDVIAQAMKIDEESARYNIGDVHRTINLPTFALAFLLPINRTRVRFEKIGEETIAGIRTWMIRLEDLRRPAFITAPSGAELRTSGRCWVDPANGRVIKTELVTGGGGSNGRITVTYEADDALGFWVPARMDESYDEKRPKSHRITGTATYSNFRRFDLKRLRNLP
jgi:hypothetical protein